MSKEKKLNQNEGIGENEGNTPPTLNKTNIELLEMEDALNKPKAQNNSDYPEVSSSNSNLEATEELKKSLRCEEEPDKFLSETYEVEGLGEVKSDVVSE